MLTDPWGRPADSMNTFDSIFGGVVMTPIQADMFWDKGFRFTSDFTFRSSLHMKMAWWDIWVSSFGVQLMSGLSSVCALSVWRKNTISNNAILFLMCQVQIRCLLSRLIGVWLQIVHAKYKSIFPELAVVHYYPHYECLSICRTGSTKRGAGSCLTIAIA